LAALSELPSEFVEFGRVFKVFGIKAVTLFDILMVGDYKCSLIFWQIRQFKVPVYPDDRAVAMHPVNNSAG
jgi:hypothetical protein